MYGEEKALDLFSSPRLKCKYIYHKVPMNEFVFRDIFNQCVGIVLDGASVYILVIVVRVQEM